MQQIVTALGRAAEQGPSLPVGQSGAQDLAPDLAGDVGGLVQHQIVQIQAAQGLGVVRAVQADARAVGQVTTQFAFMETGTGDHAREMPQIIPGHGLGLPQIGGGVGGAPVRAGSTQGRPQQVVDGGHGLAETAVAEQHAKAGALLVEAPLQRARRIGDDAGRFHVGLGGLQRLRRAIFRLPPGPDDAQGGGGLPVAVL